LKGFTDRQGALWVCEKLKPLRESKPKKEANRPDYYTHVETGERDETAEDVLKAIESRVAPIICKLANPHYELTSENATHLNVFVAFMFARVPSWREHLDTLAAQVARGIQLKIANDKEAFHKDCADYDATSGKPLGIDYEALRQYVLKGDFDIEQNSTAFNLGAMFDSALGIAERLRNYGHEVLYAPEGKFFLTSDSPVYTVQPDGKGEATVGVGFGWPGVEVIFPLNKRACLRMKVGLTLESGFIEEGYVDQINHLIMATATKYLFSSERYRRISRLFDEHGCKVRPGKESFLTAPPSQGKCF
jgi:hypothetical protein